MTIERAVERWLRDGTAQGHARTTTEDRRRTMRRLRWWLEHEAQIPTTLESLTADTIRAFLGYLQQEGPRWGSAHASAQVAKVRPSTVATYHRTLRAFLRWCAAEELVRGPVMKNVRAPRLPKENLPPFTVAQVQAMRAYLAQTENPERDTTLFLLLLDTGIRVSELCSLRIADVSRETCQVTITGKGNKQRAVYLGQAVRRALWRYLELCRRHAEPDEPLFLSTRGVGAGNALTRRGVYRLVSFAATAAGVADAHRGPHAIRRTFAVNFLRNGGNVYELQRIMGHEDLETLQKYLRLAEVDLEDAHRQASPADRLFRNK